MTAEKTMIQYVQEQLDAAEAKRRARFDSAKTNLEKLMAAGVVITCDDAHENAMRWDYTSKLAKEAGVTFQQMEAAQDFARIANALVDEWKRISENGETDDEHSARVRAEAAKQPARVQTGKKKPCTHTSTQRERGLMSCGVYRHVTVDPGSYLERWACCRCGLDFTIPYRPTTPTDAARAAHELYVRFRNPEYAKQ